MSLFGSFSELRFFLNMILVPLESRAQALSNKVESKKYYVQNNFLESENYLNERNAGQIFGLSRMSRMKNSGYSGRGTPVRYVSCSMMILLDINHKSIP